MDRQVAVLLLILCLTPIVSSGCFPDNDIGEISRIENYCKSCPSNFCEEYVEATKQPRNERIRQYPLIEMVLKDLENEYAKQQFLQPVGKELVCPDPFLRILDLLKLEHQGHRMSEIEASLRKM